MLVSKVKQFLQQAASEGKFGDGAEIVDFFFGDAKGVDQFASNVTFVTVNLDRKDANKHVDIVVKMQHDNASVRDVMQTDTQFFNEKIMYAVILPFLNHENFIKDIFPDFYYGVATHGENPPEDVIVLQDLRSCGYRHSTETIYLDYDHCVITMRQLGRFHALSYAAKERDFEQLIHKVGQLKDARYGVKNKDDVNKLLVPSIRRGVEPLIAVNEHKEELNKFLSATDDAVTFMLKLLEPEEPLAVLCHGDFCRNNVLYKYDGGDTNTPTNVKFFDLGTSRYTSPAIDISFFLFLNVPPNMRKERWDDLLEVYHGGLSEAVPGTKVPSLDDIKTEMKRKAVYGYIICSFFVPMMIDESKMVLEDMEDFAKMSAKDLEEMGKMRGGDKATGILVDLVRDLVLHECL